LAKRIAQTASPLIRPYDAGEDGEWYVMLAHPYAFRDLKISLATVYQNAMPRSLDNPLFKDGDIQWDGVIIREDPSMLLIDDEGNGGTTDVTPCVLLGAQAAAIAWAQRPKPIFQERDYGNIQGVGLAEIKGVEKLVFNSKQNGVVTLYTSCVADT
jgi:hypothetical protein